MGFPSLEEARAYLSEHPLQQLLETAANDAVMRQVADPFSHIAMICLEKSKDKKAAQRAKAQEMRQWLGEKEDAKKEVDAKAMAALRRENYALKDDLIQLRASLQTLQSEKAATDKALADLRAAEARGAANSGTKLQEQAEALATAKKSLSETQTSLAECKRQLREAERERDSLRDRSQRQQSNATAPAEKRLAETQRQLQEVERERDELRSELEDAKEVAHAAALQATASAAQAELALAEADARGAEQDLLKAKLAAEKREQSVRHANEKEKQKELELEKDRDKAKPRSSLRRTPSSSDRKSDRKSEGDRKREMRVSFAQAGDSSTRESSWRQSAPGPVEEAAEEMIGEKADEKTDTLALARTVSERVFDFLDQYKTGRMRVSDLTSFGATLYHAAVEMLQSTPPEPDEEASKAGEPVATRAYVRGLLHIAQSRPGPDASFSRAEFVSLPPAEGLYAPGQLEAALRLVLSILENDDGLDGVRDMMEDMSSDVTSLHATLYEGPRTRLFAFLRSLSENVGADATGTSDIVHAHWLDAFASVCEQASSAAPMRALATHLHHLASEASGNGGDGLISEAAFCNFVPPRGTYSEASQEGAALGELMPVLDIPDAAAGIRADTIALVAERSLGRLFTFLDEAGNGYVSVRQLRAFVDVLLQGNSSADDSIEGAAVTSFVKANLRKHCEKGRPERVSEKALCKYSLPGDDDKVLAKEAIAVHSLWTVLDGEARHGLRDAIDEELENQ